MKQVTDKRGKAQPVKEQKELEKALSLGQRNYADDMDYRSRAKDVIASCIQENETGHAQRVEVWDKLNRVYHLESLSGNARDYGIHLGTIFAGVEEYATKMAATVFNGRPLVGGKPMDRDHGKKAKAAVGLIEEQLRTELKLEEQAIEFFREAGIHGAAIWKVVPSAKVHRTYKRDVRSRETDEGTVYEFAGMEPVEIADTRVEARPVMPTDFRIPITARSIEDAAWCGDYSYPTEQELRDHVDRGWYDAQAVEELLQPTEEGSSGSKPPTYGTANSRFPIASKVGTKDQADAGDHLAQFGRFEWWGEMDLHGDGRVIPVVVTIVSPATETGSTDVKFVPSLGTVVRITENPFFHQRKPYVAYRPLPRQKEFWTMGIAEVLANNSKYEDDLAMVGLMGAFYEMSPPMEIGVDAGVDEDELDGFLPGLRYYAEQTGQVGFIAPPARSGTGFQTAEYFSTKAEKNMGLGRPDHAPRTPAAGVMTDAQQTDLRQMAWVTAFEQQTLIPLAELLHGLAQQYLTKERKIRILGMDGIHAEDVTTVDPTDLAVDVRFEPVVGKQLLQQGAQVQGLINLFDRAASLNMMSLQLGKPEPFDLVKIVETLMRDGFMVRAGDYMNSMLDPSELPTPQEEHYGFQQGERPVVHKNENHMAHAMAHMTFMQAGGTNDWEPEDRQAFIDHIHDTIQEVARTAQQAMPTVQDAFDELLGRTGDEPSRKGMSGAEGGSGFAAPGQSPGSPLHRSPARGAGLQMGQNSGAM